jgi:hypothetical protein
MCYNYTKKQLTSTKAMQPLRRRINPRNFNLTLRQIAKLLKIPQERILNWEKWHNVLWVHIKGLGGHFVSYRKLEQWIVACRALMQSCTNLEALKDLWLAILKEAKRYTENFLSRLEAMQEQRLDYLASLLHN